MKRRQSERVERRRPQVNLNLAGEQRSRSVGAGRGCASMIGRMMIVGALVALVLLGLR